MRMRIFQKVWKISKKINRSKLQRKAGKCGRHGTTKRQENRRRRHFSKDFIRTSDAELWFHLFITPRIQSSWPWILLKTQRNKSPLTEESKKKEKVFCELVFPYALSKCHRYAEPNKCDDMCIPKRESKTKTCGESLLYCKHPGKQPLWLQCCSTMKLCSKATYRLYRELQIYSGEDDEHAFFFLIHMVRKCSL